MVVYGLREVGKEQLMYVGGTTANTAAQRFTSHKKDYDKHNKFKTEWLQKVNHNIEYTILEDGIDNLKDLVSKEIGYIKLLRACGAALTNISPGGDGYDDYTKTRVRVIYNTKPVYQFDLNGVFIKEFKSCKVAAKVVGASRTGISSCCTQNSKERTAKGFQWRYKQDCPEKILPPFVSKVNKDILGMYKRTHTRKVVKLDAENNILAIYSSCKEACEINSIKESALFNTLNGYSKTTKNMRFKYI